MGEEHHQPLKNSDIKFKKIVTEPSLQTTGQSYVHCVRYGRKVEMMSRRKGGEGKKRKRERGGWRRKKTLLLVTEALYPIPFFPGFC